MLHELPGLECCEHTHDDHGQVAEDDHEAQPQNSADSNPCGICHMIESNGVSLIQPIILASVHFLPVAELTLPALDEMPVAESAVLEEALVEPPIRLRWGAYLVSTCLPVRGPNLA